jgi:hypothetical protein
MFGIVQEATTTAKPRHSAVELTKKEQRRTGDDEQETATIGRCPSLSKHLVRGLLVLLPVAVALLKCLHIVGIAPRIFSGNGQLCMFKFTVWFAATTSCLHPVGQFLVPQPRGASNEAWVISNCSSVFENLFDFLLCTKNSSELKHLATVIIIFDISNFYCDLTGDLSEKGHDVKVDTFCGSAAMVLGSLFAFSIPPTRIHKFVWDRCMFRL